MTVEIPGPQTPDSQPPHPERRPHRWPDASTPAGAILYVVIAELIVWIIVGILSHIHIAITWH
jgi:hypothetical protein